MLEEVLALFCQRYGLTEPDDSAGVRAIQGAMRGSVTIAELRNVLTTKYNLYPQYEGRILAILDSLDAATETTETVSTDAAVIVEPEVELPTPPPASTPTRRSNKR